MEELKNGWVSSTITFIGTDGFHSIQDVLVEYLKKIKNKKSLFIVGVTLEMESTAKSLSDDLGMEFVEIDTISGRYERLNEQFRDALDNGKNIITDDDCLFYLDDFCTNILFDCDEYFLVLPNNWRMKWRIKFPSIKNEDMYETIRNYTKDHGDGLLMWKDLDLPVDGHEDLRNMCEMRAIMRVTDRNNKENIYKAVPYDFWSVDIIFY